LVNYNFIAPLYDRLKKLVFGDQIDVAERTYYHRVKSGEKVLVVGGGTGTNLKFLSNSSHITYIDSSSKMIEIAREKRKNAIQFTICDFLEFESSEQFDWIICPFVLDVFTEEDLKDVILKLKVLIIVVKLILFR